MKHDHVGRTLPKGPHPLCSSYYKRSHNGCTPNWRVTQSPAHVMRSMCAQHGTCATIAAHQSNHFAPNMVPMLSPCPIGPPLVHPLWHTHHHPGPLAHHSRAEHGTHTRHHHGWTSLLHFKEAHPPQLHNPSSCKRSATHAAKLSLLNAMELSFRGRATLPHTKWAWPTCPDLLCPRHPPLWLLGGKEILFPMSLQT